MPDRPLDRRVKPRSKQERLPRTSAIPQVRRRGVRSPVLQPGPLGLRHGLGRRTGLLESAGLSGTAATVAHLALVWGSEQVILPSLNVSAPVFKYGGKATATDLWRHGVCVTATGVAYSYLDRCQFPLVGGRSRRGSSSSILSARA